MVRRLFCKTLLVAFFVVLALLALPGVLLAQGGSEEGLARAIAAQEKHTDILLAKPGVVGTAVGLDQNGRTVVKVFTAAKGVGGIPANLEAVPVEVVVTGEFVARADFDRTAKYRPAPIGVSTGHPDITAGTIGCRVTDGGNVYALSNNHVYANENQASINDAVIQPGKYDGGSSPVDDIGTLFDFEPINFKGNARNKMDAAIALSTTAELDNATPYDGYGVPSSTTAAAFVGQSVQKYGRTTGLQHGNVTAINATVRVSYGTRSAVFDQQIVVEPGSFSAGGDSGSLIVTHYPGEANDKEPVGLLFAGSSSHTIANPIDAVLTRFGVYIDGSSPGPVALTITTTSLPNATVNTTYSASVEAIGGTGSYAWAIASGVLPAGLGLDLSTGVISGTPTEQGVSNFTVQVTDSTETATQALSITVGSAPQAGTTVSVASISYATEGGKDGTKHLLITVALANGAGAVAGASVSIDLYLDGSFVGSATGTTGADGTVTFSLKNAPSGTYTTEVTGVIAAGLTWDGVTPENSFPK